MVIRFWCQAAARGRLICLAVLCSLPPLLIASEYDSLYTGGMQGEPPPSRQQAPQAPPSSGGGAVPSPDTITGADAERMLNDRGLMNDLQTLDYDDSEEMTLAYFLCGAKGFEGSECQRVYRKCSDQAKALERAIRKGKSYKPWVCTDPRVVRKFL